MHSSLCSGTLKYLPLETGCKGFDWGTCTYTQTLPTSPLTLPSSSMLAFATVGVDEGSDHVYGIPEHATSMSLKTTAAGHDGVSAYYSEPYRLYTLDVFEFELDSAAALYGSIPVMLGHRKGSTSAVFWFNPTETFVDVEEGRFCM